ACGVAGRRRAPPWGGAPWRRRRWARARGVAPPRRRAPPAAARAAAPRGSSSRARGSWELPEHRLAERDLGEHEAERGPLEPGVQLAVVEELRRLEGRLLGAVDLGVDVVEALRVGGPEVAAVRHLRDFLERLLVDVDRYRAVDLVAEHVLHRKRREAARAGTDGVDLDAEGGGGLGGGLGRDAPRVLLPVGQEHDELALRGRRAQPVGRR